MTTKLGRYADGIMEAAWLIAVMVVPVFFNIYSSRIFEPDKITLLRSIALIILAAWVVKLFEQGGFNWEHFKNGSSGWKSILKLPLIRPVVALGVVYLLATLFSVTPRISLLGSYQRLQGTYTTFSYIIIFVALATNIRRRAQVDRLLSVAVLASLPVSLYGILQRNGLDPIPWGGDVTTRIASNMGNSIFVAAYLIMVFSITLLRIVESFDDLLAERGNPIPNFIRATSYVFILALQAIAIYYSGSRGPWLGWAASIVFVWLGLSLIWKARWLTIAGVVLAVISGSFLVTLNIEGGPLEGLRNRPEFGRLGQLLNTESRTGKVRSLIWDGASDLVTPHEPLEYPDEKLDPFNVIRPLIGYGPESMYVAYNRYYPPELTQVEKRNASPDRSHNETWDSLVITGVLGLAVYLILFGSALYYGLKWLGLVQSTKQRNLYLSVFLMGGLISSIGFVLWKGWGYFGVALPFGMIVGVVVYLVYVALFGKYSPPRSMDEKLRAYILLALLSGIMAHFVEINFGIAIAATRLYFWVYIALLLLVGMILPFAGQFGQQLSAESSAFVIALSDQVSPEDMVVDSNNNKKRKPEGRKKKRARYDPDAHLSPIPIPTWLHEGMLVGLLVAVLLITLGFNFITNASRASGAVALVWNSFASLDGRFSIGVIALIVTSWLVGVFLIVSDIDQKTGSVNTIELKDWIRICLVALGFSALLASIYWMWHAANLLNLTSIQVQTIDDVLAQVKRSEGILSLYYFYLFILLLFVGALIPIEWPVNAIRNSFISLGITSSVILVAIIMISMSNLRVIQADIAFKTGDLFANAKNWQPAIAVYDRARKLAPNEDYYYLFLGRAYLEQAKQLEETDSRERFIQQAAQDLRSAQDINPLNTDHTANLARLYSLWSNLSSEPGRKNELASRSEDFFATAISLSPNNARLWDEWATLYLNNFGLPDQAIDKLERAVDLDPYYDFTYGLLADYTVRYVLNDPSLSDVQKRAAMADAVGYYQRAIELADSSTSPQLLGYFLGLAGLQTQLGEFSDAITSYEASLPYAQEHPGLWQIMEALARLYAQIGNQKAAISYATQALDLAPEDQMGRLEDLVVQLGGQP